MEGNWIENSPEGDGDGGPLRLKQLLIGGHLFSRQIGKGFSGVRLFSASNSQIMSVSGLRLLRLQEVSSRPLLFSGGIGNRFGVNASRNNLVESQAADNGEDYGESSNPPRRPGRTPSRPITGAFFLLLGFALLKFAFLVVDKPAPTEAAKILLFGLGVAAVASTFHGIVLRRSPSFSASKKIFCEKPQQSRVSSPPASTFPSKPPIINYLPDKEI
jgi:hypothetical protein